MKTAIAIGLCFVGAPLFAQKIDSKTVPAPVKAALEKSFQVKDAKWEKEGENFEAEFKKNGKEMSAIFAASGVMLGTEEEIAKTDLPRSAQEVIQKEYAGYKLEEASKVTDKGVIKYEAEIEKGESSYKLSFDVDGKFLKKVEEKKDEII
jgi:hypothetical protein